MTALTPNDSRNFPDIPRPDSNDQVPAELSEVFEQCASLVKQGLLDEARRELEDAAERFPDNPLARYNLSVAYFLALRRAMDVHGL